VIFDTDVLIWVLRGNQKAAAIVLEEGARAISIVSSMELLQGARNKEDMAVIRKFLAGFEPIPLSAEISYRAMLYVEQHTLRTSLSAMDALIAATAVERQQVFCSGNVKHYAGIEGLDLRRFRS
jgi:predicted nucleic acid-binding protein